MPLPLTMAPLLRKGIVLGTNGQRRSNSHLPLYLPSLPPSSPHPLRRLTPKALAALFPFHHFMAWVDLVLLTRIGRVIWRGRIACEVHFVFSSDSYYRQAGLRFLFTCIAVWLVLGFVCVLYVCVQACPYTYSTRNTN